MRRFKFIQRNCSAGRLACWLLLGLALSRGPSGARAALYQVGDVVENFSLIDHASGRPVKLSDLAGNIIFLDWFAWW